VTGSRSNDPELTFNWNSLGENSLSYARIFRDYGVSIALGIIVLSGKLTNLATLPGTHNAIEFMVYLNSGLGGACLMAESLMWLMLSGLLFLAQHRANNDLNERMGRPFGLNVGYSHC